MRPEGPGGSRYDLWAPAAERLEVVLADGSRIPLGRDPQGWHRGLVEGLRQGDRYRLSPDGKGPWPDPASRHQPDGLEGPSAVWSPDPEWADASWRGHERADLVFYELHVGTFTPQGTLDAAAARLPDLADLGVTAVELMPLAQCPGCRNWGYDGALPFAVQHSYGGPRALQRFVEAAHRRGLGVIVDAVYNHLGPEGDHLADFLPIRDGRHRTPWGEALNFDGAGADAVQSFFLANARWWCLEMHVDGLRLDAVHAIVDQGADPFLARLARAAGRWGARRGFPVHLVGECDLNASRYVREPAAGGYGLHAQWLDDFHHALHAAITGERHGYYEDYGAVDDLRRAYERAYVFDGRWSPHRRRTVGDHAGDLPGDRFVVFAQNHDHVGNRFGGERLARLTDAAGLRCAAAAVLLSPYLPLLFMGEERGETAPFHYFIDHRDPALVAGVREGRLAEFAAQAASAAMPDPADPATMRACALGWARPDGEASRLRGFYRACLQLRRSLPALRPGPRRTVAVDCPHPAVVAVRRDGPAGACLLLVNPGGRSAAPALPAGAWRVLLDSQDAAWGGHRTLETAVDRRLELPPRTAVLLTEESP